jgi:uncharacterized protein (DUF305 family)
MTIQNQTLVVGVVALAIGLALGFVAAKPDHDRLPPRGMHQMDNSEMMYNDMMDHGRMNMDDMMMTMTKNLQGKTGATFDKAFIDDMIPHHQGAVEMAELVLTSTERPELKKMAQEIIDAQTKEIKMMQEWQKEWFTTTTN